MFIIPTYTKRSVINGRGVFTENPLSRGQKIWVFEPGTDLCIPFDMLEDLPEPLNSLFENYCYIDRSLYSEGYIYNGDNAKYTNHSLDPNISCRGRECFALRDIRAGEELTCNYQDFDWDEQFGPPDFVTAPELRKVG